MLAPTIVQRCHQLALKVEGEKKRKGDSNFKDRGKGRNKRAKRGGHMGREANESDVDHI